MRTLLAASLLALGIGLTGTLPGAAMPASGNAIQSAAHGNRMVERVHLWRRHHHRHHHRHCWWHHGRMHCGW